MFVLPWMTAPTRAEIIKLPSGDTFTLTLQRPTYAARLHDEGLQLAFYQTNDPQCYVEQMRQRVAAAVVGWEEVVDQSGEPVPFSPKNLEILLSCYPSAAAEIAAVLRKLFLEDQSAAKKSAPPPESSSEKSPAAAEVVVTNLDFTCASATPPTSAASSA